MSLRHSFAGLLVGVLLVLTPLAYASPPDPTWMPGVWDDADYDDVVLLVTFGLGASDAQAPSDAGSAPSIVSSMSAVDEWPTAAPTLSSRLTRAPPVH